MRLVENGLFPRTPVPRRVRPRIGRGIDHDAWARDVIRLEARSRVGNKQLAVDAVLIAAAGVSLRHDDTAPAVAVAGDLIVGPVKHERDLARGRGPQREPHAAAGELGAERHGMRPPHQSCPEVPAYWKSTSERGSSG